VLAKVADLSSYRVEARISEIHAANISVGMLARIRLSLAGKNLSIGGHVSHISPSVENGVISLQIRLAEASHEALRPSQRVEVYLISAERQAAMRLYRPSFVTRSGRSEVFVIRGNEAVKTTVETGLRGAEMVEIISGLQPGDEVITSDMSEYAHVKKVKLQ
jgi:HlyD family secretion protein